MRSLGLSGWVAALALASCVPALGANIGDLVWEDLNRNGLQDAGEPGIADVLVQVAGGVVFGSASSRGCWGSTTTDAAGHYSVAPSAFATNCHLTFTAPTLAHARYEPTISGVGGMWPDRLTGDRVTYYDYLAQHYLPMADNDSDMGYTFIEANGHIVSAPLSTPPFTMPLMDTEFGNEWPAKVDAGFVRWVNGGVSGRVWVDLDRDGQQGAGEPGLAGVRVDLMLRALESDIAASVTTDATGRFSFDDLRSNWFYLLRVVKPAGWEFSSTDVGSDLTDNDFSQAGFGTLAGALLFNLESAEQRSSLAAGFFDPGSPPVPEPATGVLWLCGLTVLGWTAAGRARQALPQGPAKNPVCPSSRPAC